jgi:S1-C subfamily serine protease
MKKQYSLFIFFIGLLIFMIASVIGLAHRGIADTAQIAPSAEAQAQNNSPALNYDIPGVVDRVGPAVVSIIGSKNVNVTDIFSGQTVSRPQIMAATGFIVSADGLIVTNNHVVDTPGATYHAYSSNGTEYNIEIIATDSVLDIAIGRINGKDLPFLQFADSDKARIGEPAIAIGNALGEFRNSVSVGVVSGLARSITAGDVTGQAEQLDELIQTDAAINPGNSGGPLLNSSGLVIGMNVATVQGSSNIGFAIPSNSVKQDLDSVRTSGKITRAFLGVRYVQINPILKQANNLSSGYGALVTNGASNEPAVIEKSPAAAAGIRDGDIIIGVDGVSMKDKTLSAALRTLKPGDTVSISFLRGGKNQNTSAKLGSR